jgi:hypothetical protein
MNLQCVLIGKKALSAYSKLLLQHSHGKTDKKCEKYLKIAGKLAEISTYTLGILVDLEHQPHHLQHLHLRQGKYEHRWY